MGAYGPSQYKGTKELKKQFDEMSKPVDLQKVEGDEYVGLRYLFLNEQERAAEMEKEKLQIKRESFLNMLQNMENIHDQWEKDTYFWQRQQLTQNKNDKTLAKARTPERISQIRQERHEQAIKADERKVFADKARHGLYIGIGAVVQFFRKFTAAGKAERATTEEPTYEVPGLVEKYKEIEGKKPKPGEENYEQKMKEFQEVYGKKLERLQNQYVEKEAEAREKAILEVDGLQEELTEEERAQRIHEKTQEILSKATFTVRFTDAERTGIEGGTKPNAVKVAQNGSKWLMKTNHSCIGTAAPNASKMTVAGYKVQNLVDPKTAIKAFETKSRGVGTVSMQKMVDNVVTRTKTVNGQKVPNPEYIDLFRFSRTPDAMTPDELDRIEQLAPQFLREYMTDFLLGNHDTKGENFLLCKDQDGKFIIRGIDKEAAGRKDLVPEAQHMQKDKHFFDQDTVYNQLFRKFADGSMNFDLNEAEQYIKRIEMMSTEEYLKIYEPYLDQQQKDYKPEEFQQIKKNVIYRKEFIRVEARRFFGELVKERMQVVSKEEAAELQKKYLGGIDGGVFLFKGETAEQLRAEREMIAKYKESDTDALKEKARIIEEKDEKRTKRRHAMYDIAKGIILGFKLKHGNDFVEERSVIIKYSDLLTGSVEQLPFEIQDRVLRNRKAIQDKFEESLYGSPEQYQKENKERYEAEVAKIFNEIKSEMVADTLEKVKEKHFKLWKDQFKNGENPEGEEQGPNAAETIEAEAVKYAEKKLTEEAEELRKEAEEIVQKSIELHDNEEAWAEIEKMAKEKVASYELYQKFYARSVEAEVKKLYDEAKGIMVAQTLELLKKEAAAELKEKFLADEGLEEFQFTEKEKDDAAEEYVKKELEGLQSELLEKAEKAVQKKIETGDNDEAWEMIEKEAKKAVDARIKKKGGADAVREKLLEKKKQRFLNKPVEVSLIGSEEVNYGGTKPMREYIAADGSRWLSKQAVNCVGMAKPSGAYLTQTGGNIQKLVDEKTAIPAFVGKTREKGMVSFQKKIDNIVDKSVLDLYNFSKFPDLATQDTIKKVESLMPQILREHVTDWLLCNFDTKGENFLVTQKEGEEGMTLYGVDKEAALNKILSPDAWQMSTTYKPHANNTLYNVVFEKFANAEMDFDLREVIPYVEKVIATDNETYLQQFDKYLHYLEEKAKGDGKELQKFEQIKRNILNRKIGLKQEYTRFFTELIERRCKLLHPDEAKALRDRYYGPGGKEFNFSGSEAS